MIKNKLSFLVSIFFIIISFIFVFYRTIDYKTVMWEDKLFSSKYYEEEYNNPHIIKKIFTTSVYFDKVKYLYRPIFVLSFYIDSKLSLGNTNTKINHITNLILHLFCVLILFCFLIVYCDFNVWISAIASVIFSINIFSVWSAVWLSGRCDLLLFFFVFLSFICFIESNINKNNLIKKSCLFLHFIFFFLALLSKETAVVLPIFFLGYACVKRYTLKIIYIVYIVIYMIYFSMYSNDINIFNRIVKIFDLKIILFTIFDYVSNVFCVSTMELAPTYNLLTIIKGIIISLLFLIVFVKIKNNKNKQDAIFFLASALLFILPTLLGKRISFQGNRMYIPMAFILISILYIIKELYLHDISKIKFKISLVLLILFMSYNIIYIDSIVNFARDDNSFIRLLSKEYKLDRNKNIEVRQFMYFLYNMYKTNGYKEEAKKLKIEYRTLIDHHHGNES